MRFGPKCFQVIIGELRLLKESFRLVVYTSRANGRKLFFRIRSKDTLSDSINGLRRILSFAEAIMEMMRKLQEAREAKR